MPEKSLAAPSTGAASNQWVMMTFAIVRACNGDGKDNEKQKIPKGPLR